MGARIQKIKTHVRDHKEAYVAGGFGVALGAIAVLLTVKDGGVNPKVTQVLSYKPKAIIDVHVEALGDPGNIIQDTATGIIYASQGQAARELNLDPGELSKHINGRNPHVKGHVFTKLGKAHVTE